MSPIFIRIGNVVLFAVKGASGAWRDAWGHVPAIVANHADERLREAFPSHR